VNRKLWRGMKCPKCDGRGTIPAPSGEDGRYICPVCYGSGKKNRNRTPWTAVADRFKKKGKKNA